MSERIVAVGIAVGVLAVLIAGGVAAADTTQAENETATDEELGASVSGFMQASTAEAEREIDDGMFAAGWNRTADDPEARQAVMERRQQRLQRRNDRLASIRGSIDTENPTVADRAKATHVSVGASGLERSANATKRVAEEAGLDTELLEELRRNASSMSGAEVADLAREIARPPAIDEHTPPENVTQGPPENVTQGPPENVTQGPPENVTDGDIVLPGNGTDGPPENVTDGDTALPENGTDGPPDDGDTGPPENGTQDSPDDGNAGPPDSDDDPGNDGSSDGSNDGDDGGSSGGSGGGPPS